MVEPHAIKVSRFKCPFCSTILKIKLVDNIESRRLMCPTCKESVLFSQLIPLSNNSNAQNIQEEKTEYKIAYRPKVMEHPSASDNPQNESTILGKIVVLGDSGDENDAKMEFPLKEGRNIIGRKSVSSSSTIQINANGSLRLSREHLIITVKRSQFSGYQYVAALYKENVNATFINDERLEYGDMILLKNGDLIKLPDVVVKIKL